MTVLVTGGAGFIGSNFVRTWLAELGEPVVTLDNLTYAGNFESLSDYRGDGRHTVLGFADDRVAASLEQPAGESAEAGVVVHDQHRLRHVRIVSCQIAPDIGEIPNLRKHRGSHRCAREAAQPSLGVMNEDPLESSGELRRALGACAVAGPVLFTVAWLVMYQGAILPGI